MMREEFVDKTQRAGGSAEKRKAWSAWATKHLDARLFEGARLLGKEGADWRNVAEHTLVVNATALWLAKELKEAGENIDDGLVDTASMLHDVTKRIEKEQGVSYAEKSSSSIQEDFLQTHNYTDPEVIECAEYTGRVPDMFIENDEERQKAIEERPLEQLLVAYADARIRNTDIVSLENARDKNKLKVPADAAIYDQWYRYFKSVEQRLFSLMDGRIPESLYNGSVYAYVLSDSREPVGTVSFFSESAPGKANEDCFRRARSSFILADGATDKVGAAYQGKSGGALVSKLVAEEALAADIDGTELVRYLNDKIAGLYERVELTEKVVDPKYRFGCDFICVRRREDATTITLLGTVGFRVNGEKIYREMRRVDERNSRVRAEYIEATGDVAGSRDHIRPLLQEQLEKFQNNPTDPLGYGVLDGTETPDTFVRVYRFENNDVKELELFSDGYVKVPTTSDIENWEKSHEEAEKEDPDKWKKYPSTKSHDDRTVAIIRF